jgi:hypothetical protein
VDRAGCEAAVWAGRRGAAGGDDRGRDLVRWRQGPAGVSYVLYKTADPNRTPIVSSDPNTLTYASGTTAVLVASRSTLDSAAAGAVTEFSWRVQVTDGFFTSNWSAICHFYFDPTRTGAPTVTPPASPTVIGQSASFAVTPPATGTVPSAYLYQLNGGAPISIPASAGSATVTIKPNRFTNVLTVTGTSAGGNIGDTATAVFNSAPAATAADQDLTGDGIPDLLAVGGGGALPAGLWAAQGQAGTGHTTGTGLLVTAATNLGANGNGVAGDNSPSDFTGAQAITGHFTGSGLQDVIAYYPGGANAGGGVILNGNGDGSAIQAQLSGNEHTLTAGTFADLNGDSPLWLANAGNSSGQNLAYPDLIGVNGDPASGYSLEYYPSQNSTGSYQFPTVLSTPTPTGGTDWNAWTASTAQVAGGTDMYLWNRATGALYLWAGLHFDLAAGTLAFTQYAIAANWNTGAAIGLQAADANGDGTPDLWTVGAGGAATAWLLTNLTATPTITALPAQTLVTSNHTWPLTDATQGPVTTAADTTGSLPVATSSGATWHTGDLFSPDVVFGGSGVLATSGPAIATNADFTASVWVKPNTVTGATGTVLSQDGVHSAAMMLYADSATGEWIFGMSTGDGSSTYDLAKAQTELIHPGAWTHLAVTFKRSTGHMELYVNGVPSAGTQHTSVWNATSRFEIGDSYLGDNHISHFDGQIANVQTWNQTLSPVQLADLSGTPGYVMFEPDNTNYPSGSTWTTAGARMTFDSGLLSITETLAGTLTKTYGQSGHPGAVLTVQTDGNLVDYPQAAHTAGTALWSPNTYPHPNDVVFLQPDGNLVVYDSDGSTLWAGTVISTV